MCNACGFHCCADDAFAGCGCDHCHDPDCWSDDDDFDGPDLDHLDDADLFGAGAEARP